MILLGDCKRAPIVKMYLLVDEECIDRRQIVKNVIILGDLGDNLAKEVNVKTYLPISGRIPVHQAFQDGVRYKSNLGEKV